MSRVLPLGVGLTLLLSCAPRAGSYEVDLTLQTLCTTRAGDEVCELAGAERQTRTLLIEPRDDSVLLLLGERLFVAAADTEPLSAERRLVDEDLEQGCVRTVVEALIAQTAADRVSGSYRVTSVTEGPAGRCGQTPLGERREYLLEGIEVDGP